MKALFHVLNIHPAKEMRCISIDTEVYDFCKQLGIECLYLNRNSDVTFKGLKVHRDYVKRFSQSFINEEIAFFFMAFDLYGLWLMYLLKKRNKVYFENIDNKWPLADFRVDFNNKEFQKFVKNKIVYWIVLRRNFNIFKISEHRFFLGITPSRLYKDFFSLKSVYDEGVLLDNIKYVCSFYKISNYDIVIIDESFRMQGQFDEIPIIKLLECWKVKGFSIAVKKRDKQPLSNKIFESFPIITGQIPAEFIINSTRLVIANHTNAINFLNQKIPVVSLIYMNDRYDAVLIDNILKRNLRNPDKILFPKTVEEVDFWVDKLLRT